MTFPRIQCIQEPGDRAKITLDDAHVLTLHFSEEYPRPFIYPLLTPSGINVLAYGHSVDLVGHSHHRGMFVAHGLIQSQGCWSDTTNPCVHQKLLKLDSGTETGTIASLNHWLIDAEPVLEEIREWTLDNNFRLALRLEFAALNRDILLGRTNFGFLALRVARTIGVAAGGGCITDSEGRKNEEEVKDQSALWCDYSGPVSPERWAGITIHDDPGNPHSPTGWMCRNDGWFSPAFNMEKEYRIKKGESLVLKYQIIPHDGKEPAL